MRFLVISGIRPSFPGLSQSQRQVTHVLLTRSPLIQPVQAPVFIVRLACVKHAASVRPEPGSNSPLENKKAWITWSQNKNETMIQTPHGVRWLITASSCHSDNQKVFKNTYKYLVSVSVNKPPQYLLEKEAIYWTKHTIEFSNNKPHEPITPLIPWQLQNVSQHLVYIFRYPHRGNSSSLPGVQRSCNTNNRETHHILSIRVTSKTSHKPEEKHPINLSESPSD